MKIRQAPMADLIKYVAELYTHREDTIHDGIINLLDEYYCKLTHYNTIMPMGNSLMDDWCDMNWSNTMENCPFVPGLIIYKKDKNNNYVYGLLYHSGYIVPKEQQTLNMSYYDIDENGHVLSHTFLSTDWEGWGAPTRYFSFDMSEYVDNNLWNFGERPLMKHKMGHDVKVLQTFIKKVFPEFIVTGYFDDATLEAIHNIQDFCNVPRTDYLNFKIPDARKVLEFLTNESVNIILPG
jgi:hypothetical protein